jgi:uncharacterized membrane protein YgcG
MEKVNSTIIIATFVGRRAAAHYIYLLGVVPYETTLLDKIMERSKAPTKANAAIFFVSLIAVLAVFASAAPANAQYYGGYACPPGYYYAPGYACVPAYYGSPYAYAPYYGAYGLYFGGVGIGGRGFRGGIGRGGGGRGGFGRGGGGHGGGGRGGGHGR